MRPTKPNENTPTTCQCCICEEMRLLEAQEAGKDYTAPPPDETNVGHPVRMAGLCGDGGAGDSQVLTRPNIDGVTTREPSRQVSPPRKPFPLPR